MFLRVQYKYSSGVGGVGKVGQGEWIYLFFYMTAHLISILPCITSIVLEIRRLNNNQLFG